MTNLQIQRKAAAEDIMGKLLSQGIGPKNFESVGKLFAVLDAYANLPEDHEENLEGAFNIAEIDRVLVYRLVPNPSAKGDSFVRVVTKEEARRLFSDT
jgi:hypothetical protein